MKFTYVYKKWNYIIFLNNLVLSSFLIYTKNVLFLRSDMTKFWFWIYLKKIKFKLNRILKFKYLSV